MFHLAAFVVLSLVLHFLFKTADRWLPREEPADVSDWPADMLASVARRANFWGTLAAFASFLVLLPGWIAVSYWIDFRLLPVMEPGDFLAVPLQWGRWIRGAVAAYVIAALVAMWVMRLVFGWRYDLMMAAGNRAYGFSARRFFYWTLVWMLPFCLEYELHSLGWCAHFQAQQLSLHQGPFDPVQEHAYADLLKIELVQPYTENRAEIGRSPEFRLTFKDHFTFTDVPWMLPWDAQGTTQKWPVVSEFVSEQSGMPISVVGKIE
jgi:hypothetical protein